MTSNECGVAHTQNVQYLVTELAEWASVIECPEDTAKSSDASHNRSILSNGNYLITELCRILKQKICSNS